MPFDVIPLNSGHAVPGLAFGCGSEWRKNPRAVDEEGVAAEVVQAVVSAAKAGFRHFDAAEYYKNEKSLGAALKATGLPRSELFVTTKLGPGLTDVPAATQRQLDLLGLDCIDLFLIHTPNVINKDDSLTFAGVWREYEKLVEQGLVRSIGVSNFLPKHFEQFLPSATIIPALNQISIYPYIYHRQDVQDTINYCTEKGIRIEAYEISTSLIRDGEKGGPLDAALDEIVSELAASGHAGATPGQVLLAWAAAKGFVGVTTSTKPARMEEYVQAGELRLSPAQVAAIDGAGKEGAERGFGQYSSWAPAKPANGSM